MQEAIDQFDPVSTENIMNEAIKKIEKEIKEDEELGRDTKRLKNRLKKNLVIGLLIELKNK